MKIIKKFDKQANYIFYFAIILHLAIMCVELGEWSIPFRGRLLQLAFLMGGLKILMTYYSKIEWVVMIVLGIIGSVSYYFTREKYVLYVVVLIFAAKSVDMERVLKLVLYVSLAATLITAGCSALGLGGSMVDVADYGRGMIETRYNFGFSHPNNFHSEVWFLTSIAVWIYKDRFDWKHYTALSVVNIGIFLLTVSKTGVIATQLMIFGGIVYRYAKKAIYDKIWIYIAGAMAYIGVLALTIASIVICGWWGYGPILDFVDRITTRRVMLAYKYARLEWWLMWRRSGVEDPIIDNGFAAIGINLGYVVWFVLIIFIAYLIFASAKRRDGIMLSLLMCSILCIYMENTFILNYVYLLCNVTYLIMMKILSEEKSEEKSLAIEGLENDK